MREKAAVLRYTASNKTCDILLSSHAFVWLLPRAGGDVGRGKASPRARHVFLRNCPKTESVLSKLSTQSLTASSEQLPNPPSCLPAQVTEGPPFSRPHQAPLSRPGPARPVAHGSWCQRRRLRPPGWRSRADNLLHKTLVASVP